MILDTSALAAIFFDKLEAAHYTQIIHNDRRRAGIIIEPFTVEQAHLARQAFHDFGKGRHPAV